MEKGKGPADHWSSIHLVMDHFALCSMYQMPCYKYAYSKRTGFSFESKDIRSLTADIAHTFFMTIEGSKKKKRKKRLSLST